MPEIAEREPKGFSVGCGRVGLLFRGRVVRPRAAQGCFWQADSLMPCSLRNRPEKMELFTMTLNDQKECVHRILTNTETQEVIDAVDAESASAGDS